jgi:hypothetical protein
MLWRPHVGERPLSCYFPGNCCGWLLSPLIGCNCPNNRLCMHIKAFLGCTGGILWGCSPTEGGTTRPPKTHHLGTFPSPSGAGLRVSILHRPALFVLIAPAPFSAEQSGFCHLERGGRIIIHQMPFNDDRTGPFPVAAFTHFLSCRVSNSREFIPTRSPSVRVY